jgi:hypothetical protein
MARPRLCNDPGAVMAYRKTLCRATIFFRSFCGQAAASPHRITYLLDQNFQSRNRMTLGSTHVHTFREKRRHLTPCFGRGASVDRG